MFKQLFHSDVDHGVSFLASANLAASGLVGFLEGLEPALKALLLIGQVSVAVATVFYVWKKAKAIQVPRRHTRRAKPAEPVVPISP